MSGPTFTLRLAKRDFKFSIAHFTLFEPAGSLLEVPATSLIRRKRGKQEGDRVAALLL